MKKKKEKNHPVVCKAQLKDYLLTTFIGKKSYKREEIIDKINEILMSH